MNTLKTGFLLILMSSLLVSAGYFMGGVVGMAIALALSLGMNFFAFWHSDKLALRMAGAKEVSPKEAPDLHFIVEEQARLSGLPKPRVYLIQNDSPNAFATGRNPQKGAVAATTGIMRILNRDELSAVMAHVMAHVGNRDTLVMTVAATVAGAITFLAMMARWSMIFGGLTGDRRGGGNGVIIGLVGLLVAAILLPVAALLVRAAISRAREYHADATGARKLQEPLGAGQCPGEAGGGGSPQAYEGERGGIAHVRSESPQRLLLRHVCNPPSNEGADQQAQGDARLLICRRSTNRAPLGASPRVSAVWSATPFLRKQESWIPVMAHDRPLLPVFTRASFAGVFSPSP